MYEYIFDLFADICDVNCDVCTDDTTCMTCLPGYLLVDGACEGTQNEIIL